MTRVNIIGLFHRTLWMGLRIIKRILRIKMTKCFSLFSTNTFSTPDGIKNIKNIRNIKNIKMTKCFFLFLTNIFQVMAESTNSSLVVPKEHPNLCYLLSSCSRCGNNCVDMNPMMTKDILWQNETLQAYGWGGWVHVGPPQLPRRQVLHPLHGRLQAALPGNSPLQVFEERDLKSVNLIPFSGDW